MTVPDAGSDICWCSFETTPDVECECCPRVYPAAEMQDAICPICFNEGLETIRREEDERAVWVTEQLELGKQWGWL